MHESTYAELPSQVDFGLALPNCNMSVADAIEYDAHRWLADIPEAVGDHQSRDSILTAYEAGRISAEDAFDALAERRLFGKISTCMEAFLLGYRILMAKAMHVPVPFPEYDPNIPKRTTDELMAAIRNGDAA